MDDSRAVSPLQDPHQQQPYRHSRHNSYSSHTSRMTYNSHAELTNRGGSRELHWRRSGPERGAAWATYLNSIHPPPHHHDPPLPANGHGHLAGDPRRGVKTILPEVVVDKQRLSVQFPVSMVNLYLIIIFTSFSFYLFYFTFVLLFCRGVSFNPVISCVRP